MDVGEARKKGHDVAVFFAQGCLDQTRAMLEDFIKTQRGHHVALQSEPAHGKVQVDSTDTQAHTYVFHRERRRRDHQILSAVARAEVSEDDSEFNANDF